MSSKESIRGVVKNLAMRSEHDRSSPWELTGKVLKGIAKAPLAVLPEFSAKQVYGSRVPPKVKLRQIWTFVLRPQNPHPKGPPYVSVEISGRKIMGTLRENDDVTITGRFDQRTNVFIAESIQSNLTGEIISAKRF